MVRSTINGYELNPFDLLDLDLHHHPSFGPPGRQACGERGRGRVQEAVHSFVGCTQGITYTKHEACAINHGINHHYISIINHSISFGSTHQEVKHPIFDG